MSVHLLVHTRVPVSVCTYKLEEHMPQRLLRVGFGLQTGLDGRQHLFVQVQDVLDIGKQNLRTKGDDANEIRHRGRKR